MKRKENNEFIEFVPTEDAVSSGSMVETRVAEPIVSALDHSTKLEDMPPVFRELALPKLPELAKANRARLLMQTPNRLFFYWSLRSNPFQSLNKALGTNTAGYSLVLKLVDLKRDSEQIRAVDADGTWWFDVEADGTYRAEIGFYAPNRPYVRALFSNTIETPRKSPSPRVDTEVDWQVSSNKFAQVLDVAGFTEDAFDVAIAGDDTASAESATHVAFGELIDDQQVDLADLAADEIRNALYLIASGLSLEALRWRISPALFAILQKRAEFLSAERAMKALKAQFDIEADEITEEDLGPAVYGVSSINFPKRLKTRRNLPKLRPVSSSS